MSAANLLLPGFEASPTPEAASPAIRPQTPRGSSAARTNGLIFREALGIAVGDVVATSYGTGPYFVVRISGPYRWDTGIPSCVIVHDRPVMSLGLRYVRRDDNGREDSAGVNEVWRADDGRWWIGGGGSYVRSLYGCLKTWRKSAGSPARDELFVLERATRPAQSALIDASPNPRLDPWPRTACVDYGAGDGGVWSCERGCGDFNKRRPGEPEDGPPPFFGPPSCPRCGGYARVVIVVEHRVPGEEHPA